MFGLIVFALLPVSAGTVLGMFEPVRRGHSIPLGIFSINRADWWPKMLLAFVVYAAVSFVIVHFIYRYSQTTITFRDVPQYALTALTFAGYVCAIPALYARDSK